MTPDQIKAKAIMAAAEVIWDRLVTSIPFIGPWAAARDEDRAGIIAEATAIVTAYERAMVRSLADAPPYDPSGRRTRALLWVPGWQTWCFGEVWRGKTTPRAHWCPDARGRMTTCSSSASSPTHRSRSHDRRINTSTLGGIY